VGEAKVVPEMEVMPAVRSNVEAMTRGEIDIQITTAKAYPRSIEQFRKKALGMATIDEDTAASCVYKIPRDNKMIEGGTVRLAEIVAAAYGNLRVQGRVVSEDERNVTLSGGAWDIENNVLYSVEVRRRITRKDGSRFSDDMVNTTANAGISIAVRNALFRAVPHTYTKEIIEQCKLVARGSAATLGTRRQKALDWFLAEAKIEAKRVFAGLGIRGIEDITIEHLETLQGIRTAIREGELTPEDAFASQLPTTGAAADPVSMVMADLGCTEDEARWIDKAWETLKTPLAGRVVQVKQFKGRLADLKALLVSMLPEQTTTDSEPRKPGRPARKKGERTGEPAGTTAGEAPSVAGSSVAYAKDEMAKLAAENAAIDKEVAEAEKPTPAGKKSGFEF